jgi:hypothetical protein
MSGGSFFAPEAYRQPKDCSTRQPACGWKCREERLDNPHAGERLQLEGRIRLPSATGASGASFVDYLRRRGVVRTLRPYRVAKLDDSGWRVFFSRLRRRLIQNLRYHLPSREGHIAAAIVLNDRMGLDNAIRESFRRTGTVHILSPSGTHVSMLAVAVWAVCRLLRLSRRVSALAVIAVIWLFVGVAAGGEPSFRAAVMGTLVAGAVALQREIDLPTSLALAGFLIVLADTGALLDPGFQFSFILVGAIVAASGWLNALAFGVTGGRLKPVGGPSRRAGIQPDMHSGFRAADRVILWSNVFGCAHRKPCDRAAGAGADGDGAGYCLPAVGTQLADCARCAERMDGG